MSADQRFDGVRNRFVVYALLRHRVERHRQLRIFACLKTSARTANDRILIC